MRWGRGHGQARRRTTGMFVGRQSPPDYLLALLQLKVVTIVRLIVLLRHMPASRGQEHQSHRPP